MNQTMYSAGLAGSKNKTAGVDVVAIQDEMVIEYKKWIDQYGLVQPDSQTSHNGIRFTSEAIAAISRKGPLPAHIRARFKSVFMMCEKYPGILERFPGIELKTDGDWESVDDYCARIAASYDLNDGFALRFLQNRHRRLYCYNEANPDAFRWKSCLARQWQLFTHAKLAIIKHAIDQKNYDYGVDFMPNIFEILWWCFAVLQGAFSKQQDSKTLSWHLVRIGHDYNKWTMRVSKFWEKKLKEHYPHGIGEVQGRYFQNYTHPNSVYLWDVFI